MSKNVIFPKRYIEKMSFDKMICKRASFYIVVAVFLFLVVHFILTKDSIPQGINLHSKQSSSSSSSSLLFDKYHHYNDLNKLFLDLEMKYPKLARTASIGTSVKGRKLLYLEMTNMVKENSPGRPKVKLVGNMHGDETVGREILIYFCQYLLNNYATDLRSKSLLDTVRLFVMPSINPDGFENSIEGSCFTPRTLHTSRENQNAVDLNRNFPDQFDSKLQKKMRIFQPETVAMMNWIKSQKYVSHFWLDLCIFCYTLGTYNPLFCLGLFFQPTFMLVVK